LRRYVLTAAEMAAALHEGAAAVAALQPRLPADIFRFLTHCAAHQIEVRTATRVISLAFNFR
jgi:hypothetical protein